MDLDQFIAQAAEKREAYRLQRHAWCASINFPFPKRRRRDQRPFPGAIDAADEELG